MSRGARPLRVNQFIELGVKSSIKAAEKAKRTWQWEGEIEKGIGKGR